MTKRAEQWRSVPDAEHYEVSDRGRVRGPSGKILKKKLNYSGYSELALSMGARGKRWYVRMNRLVLLAFVGPPPSKMHHAAHRNGIRDDNRLANLTWLTPKENSHDMVAHGTRFQGERVNHLARLTRAMAEAVWMDPRSIAEIAEEIGVTYQAIWHIKRGKTWKHLAAKLGQPVPAAVRPAHRLARARNEDGTMKRAKVPKTYKERYGSRLSALRDQ